MEGFDFNKLLSDTAGFFTEDTKDTKSEAPRPKTTLEHKDSQKAVHGSARGKPDEVAKLLLQERKRYNKLKEELVLKEKELAEANVSTSLTLLVLSFSVFSVFNVPQVFSGSVYTQRMRLHSGYVPVSERQLLLFRRLTLCRIQ